MYSGCEIWSDFTYDNFFDLSVRAMNLARIMNVCFWHRADKLTDLKVRYEREGDVRIQNRQSAVEFVRSQPVGNAHQGF